MPRHRRCQLPQRIGKDVRQHQIERARACELRRREAGGADRLHQIAGAVEPRISRATRTESGSMSLASTLLGSAFAAAIASTPVPVPRSSTRRGRQAFST